jgi:cyclase
MIKQRLVGVVLVKDGVCVQSIGFDRFLPIGSPEIAVEHFNRWSIDEIVMLDISAPRTGARVSSELIAAVAPRGLVPLAVGGGLKTVDDVRQVVKLGADRIVITTAAVDNPQLISEVAGRFGDQCVIVGIDARRNRDGSYSAFVEGGRRATGRSPIDIARMAQAHGAGEILIQAIDRDGSKQGYDCDLVERVADAVQIPVIALGGVGSPAHFREAADISGVGGLAAGNYFHFTEHTALVAKAFLIGHGVAMRHDSYADYREFSFLPDGRLAKKADAALEELFFVHYTDEVI